MRKVTGIGPLVFFGNILIIAFCFAAGPALTSRVSTPMGFAAALLLPAIGVILVCSLASTLTRTRAAGRPVTVRHDMFDGEGAQYLPRGHGAAWWLGTTIPGILGIWCLAMGALALRGGVWVGAALLAVPAAFFLAMPILALTGRLRPGGVWVTPTRLIDEQPGVRSEVALSDLRSGVATESGIYLDLARPGCVHVTRTLRWGGPGMAMTMDFRPDRLTVSYDEAMTITSARCG